jgi:hypothetical protein
LSGHVRPTYVSLSHQTPLQTGKFALRIWGYLGSVHQCTAVFHCCSQEFILGSSTSDLGDLTVHTILIGFIESDAVKGETSSVSCICCPKQKH